MRKALMLALALSLSAAPAALAERGGHGPKGPEHADRGPAHVDRGRHDGPKGHRHRVAFVIKGTLATDADPASSTIQVLVERVNRHAKRALAGPDARGGGQYSASVTVTVGPKTVITKWGKRDHGRATVAALHAGDRVVVKWKAPRGTAFVDLGPARRIVDRGPWRPMR